MDATRLPCQFCGRGSELDSGFVNFWRESVQLDFWRAASSVRLTTRVIPRAASSVQHKFWQAIIYERLRPARAGHTLSIFSTDASSAAAAASAAVSSGHSIDFIVIPLLSFDDSFQYQSLQSW
jgi:hypothetical protein